MSKTQKSPAAVASITKHPLLRDERENRNFCRRCRAIATAITAAGATVIGKGIRDGHTRLHGPTEWRVHLCIS